MRRRVLLVARAFAPTGGAASLRAVKLAKYLRRFGWEPVVLTDSDEDVWPLDASLLAEIPEGVRVVRVPRLFHGMGRARVTAPAHWEPRAPTARHPGLTGLAATLLIPDPGVLWALPAARRAIALARGCDAVLTTAPPFSHHLVGYYLSRRLGLPWVLDNRDSWPGNPDFARRGVAGAVSERLFSGFVRACNSVTVVSDDAGADLVRAYPHLADRVFVAMNGYDPDDLPRVDPPPSASTFTIAHAGTLHGRRDPSVLLDGLRIAARADVRLGEALRLRLVGNVPDWALRRATEALGPSRVDYLGLREHRDALAQLGAADVLLVLTSTAEAGRAAMTSKLAEYLGLGRPVLFVGPDGPGARLVTRLGAGEVVAPDDPESIASAVRRLYEASRGGATRPVGDRALRSLTRIATAETVARALAAAVAGAREGTRTARRRAA